MRKFGRFVIATLILVMLAGTCVPMVEAEPAARSGLSFNQARDLPPAEAGRTPLIGADESVLPEADGDGVLVVKHEALLAGSDVTCVGIANADRPGLRGVRLVFAGDSKAALARVTGEHVGDRVAIVLDGKVLMAPQLLDPVTGGEVLITARSGGEVARLRDAIHRDAGVALCPE